MKGKACVKLKTKVAAIFGRITDIGAFLSCMLVAFMMLVISGEVVLRRILGRPLSWMTDVTEYSLLYIAFLGAAWLLREDGHVRIDLVLNYLKPRARAILNAATSGVGAIICLVITWESSRLTWWAMQTGLHVLKAIEIPKWIPLAIIPVGSFLLSIQFLINALTGSQDEVLQGHNKMSREENT